MRKSQNRPWALPNPKNNPLKPQKVRKTLNLVRMKWNIENNSSLESINEAYEVFGFEPNSLLSLEDYLKEYFATMLKKLRDLNYDQTQAARRKDLTF